LDCAKEWNIQDAYIKNLKGERIVDKKFNLHVVNYSVPKQVDAFRGIKNTSLPYLITLTVPYRTSYYKESWGFV